MGGLEAEMDKVNKDTPNWTPEKEEEATEEKPIHKDVCVRSLALLL